MIKYLVLFLMLLPVSLYAQQGTIEGTLSYTYHGSNTYFPMRVLIKGTRFSDSITIDSFYHYKFEHLKPGRYHLEVRALRGITGFKDVLITDINFSDHLTVDTIILQKVKSCESAPVMLGRRKNKEYYKTGELFAEGQYQHSHKVLPENKKPVIYYKKTGIWKYYKIDGKLEKICIYKNDDLKSFTSYYPNGKEKDIGYYSFGCQTGNWKHYREDGKLQYIINLDDIDQLKIRYIYLKKYFHSQDVLNPN